MNSIPTRETSSASGDGKLKARFDQLAKAWLTETAFVSSSDDLVAHPAFQEIVRMGSPVIPLLLHELEAGTGHWHRALTRITGADPVPAADRGNIAKVRAAWLQWGKEQGFEW
jgi:hypothetical protein